MTLADPGCREQPEVTPHTHRNKTHSLAPSESHTWCALRGGLWGLEMPKARASAMAGPKE